MISWIEQNLLTIAIFLPLAGALAIALVPRKRDLAARYVAISISIVTFVISIGVAIAAGSSGEFELVREFPWIPSLGIYYRVGVDGASSVLIVLTALLFVVALLASWREIGKRQGLFYAMFLVMETGLIGVFASLDMFLFYIFWDFALIPMCFVIAIWGSGNRIRTAVKYIIFTLVGSLVMLVALIYVATETQSFNLIDWYAYPFAPSVQLWLFLGFALAFAIKVPIVGLHTWLPDAHAEAPTAGSIILAGVMLKVGAYGFFRIAMPLFPQAVSAFSTLFLALALAGIIGGALLAMVQEDLKRLIAYSSISHMGLVVLGLFSLERYAVSGAIFLMFAHGLIVAGLFATARFLYERKGTRMIARYGGAARSFPMITIVFIVLVLAALGLPGLAGFTGEFLILMGSFQTKTLYSAVAVLGVIITASYFIWLVQRVFMGPPVDEDDRMKPDLRAREYLCVLPLVIALFVAGVWPKDILNRIWRPADTFVTLARRWEIVVPVRDGGTTGLNLKDGAETLADKSNAKRGFDERR